MTPHSELLEREYRLARHYLNKLRTVNDAMQRGQSNVWYSLTVFDQEWEQIRHWQAWTAQRAPEDELRARLCIEFPLTGLEVLANRNNAEVQIKWLQAGLEAARELQDKEAVRSLGYELMMVYYRLGSLEAGRDIAHQLLDLGEEANDLVCIERAHFGLAVYSEERGKYSDAEQSYQQALRLSRKLGVTTEIGRALNALGGVAQYVGEFEKSYQYVSQYLELMELHGKQNRVCHALISLGESLLSLKAYTDAEQCLQRAVRMCRSLGFQRLLGVGLLTLGALALAEDNLDMAQTYVTEGLQEVRAVGVQRQIVSGLTKLGYIDLLHEDFAGAFGHLQEGLEIARDVGNPRYICEVQLALAHAFIAVNDYDSARDILHESLSIVQSIESRSQKIRILSGVVAYFQLLGHHKQAAIVAGAIKDELLVDAPFFGGVRAQLETTLGTADYHEALAKGARRSLEEIIAEVLVATT
jgi:tetratricopeptide (TPR) repeat protein